MRLKDLYQDSWSRNHKDHSTKETPDFWDTRAEDFSLKSHMPAQRLEVESFLNQFDWSDSETVLDIGAGPGTHAIPLAKMGKRVTALDFSQGMLTELEKVAQKEKVQIQTLRGRWLEIELAKRYDTVLCLNSLGVASCDAEQKSHLLKTLEKLKNACAKQLIILIPHADSPLSEDMRKLLNIDNLTQERKRIATLYFAMVECGMLPNLSILNKPFTWVFNDLDEGVNTLLAKAGVYNASPEQKGVFKEHLASLVAPRDDGKILFTHSVKQALYVQRF
jgi:cyclopropane fatty-acyl-phospholipid synthase-like methyltransferase